MVNFKFEFSDEFEKAFKKIKDKKVKQNIYNQIEKIVNNPFIGKPMKYNRKNTREVYLKPYRISYTIIDNKLIIIFLDIYHKDKQ